MVFTQKHMDIIHYVKIIKIIIQKMSRKIVEEVALPDKPLTNFELLSVVNKLGIPNIRGVFLRDVLPKKISKERMWYTKLG